MNPTLMVCVPGPWKDRKEFLTRVVQDTEGDFMFAGRILAEPSRKRHVTLDFCERYPNLKRAFEIAGQGKISRETLGAIANHQSIAYLHFETAFIQEREKIIDFTRLMQRVGGFALKVESAGVAHEWDTWFLQVGSDKPFDWYRTLVALIGDDLFYFSCGMHHFDLPDVEAPRSIPIGEAADLMNRFNYWQIVEEPKMESGHTFSLTPEATHFRLERVSDQRHGSGDLFHNPHGLWRLTNVGQSAGPNALPRIGQP